MRAILYGIPFSALLSQVRTTENHLFAQKVLFFCSKKMYNVVGMCSFLLFVGDFRDLSAKFAIAIYPREGTKTEEKAKEYISEMIAIYPREGTKTLLLLFLAGSSHHCNLSPRGDENPYIDLSRTVLKDCNLSPRGDENRLRKFVPVSAIYCNLSPRGDENRAFIDNGIVIEDCNLSPRGDENPLV